MNLAPVVAEESIKSATEETTRDNNGNRCTSP